MIQACFAVPGPGHLVRIHHELIMHISKYFRVKCEGIYPIEEKIRVPEQMILSTLQNKKQQMLQACSQTPDLKLICIGSSKAMQKQIKEMLS